MDIEDDLLPESGTLTQRFARQRDTRTSLAWKQGFLGFILVTLVVSTVSLGGGYYVSDQCGEQDWLRYYFYVFIGLFAIWIGLTIYMMVDYQWTWMTTMFRNERYGPDMEDIEPGYFAREGTALYLDGVKAKNNIEIDLMKGRAKVDQM